MDDAELRRNERPERVRRGDAVVSELHGNFIVNRGRASAADVLTLIEDVRDRVAQEFGIALEREVELWRAGRT